VLAICSRFVRNPNDALAALPFQVQFAAGQQDKLSQAARVPDASTVGCSYTLQFKQETVWSGPKL
jgi:hypothetical protein